MKDNKKLLTVLNQILVDELADVKQNIIQQHGSVNLDFGEVYEEVNKEIEKEITEELKEAEWLIKRIIFLEVWRTRKPNISIKSNNSDESYELRSNIG